jgi:phage tail-like protein
MISQPRSLVRMPEVVGLPFRKAKLLVENAGLVVEHVDYQESYEPRDQVLAQKPTRGQMVYTGDKVSLTISRESYVKWLPTIYQRNDVDGKNFLRDFLWVTQHVFSSVEDTLDVLHTFFDSYEAPEEFLPWLASWAAMVIDEEWPLAKKRRLIKRAIELYRLRGTVKGLKLILSMFSDAEPEFKENQWPFKGWRVGVTSAIGIDTVVLPQVNLAHAFIVEMPVAYTNLAPESVVRIHELIQMEKPAHTQYYLRFAAEDSGDGLQEFMAVGLRSGIGVEDEAQDIITDESELQKVLERQGREEARREGTKAEEPEEDPFIAPPRKRPPLPKAPRADNAPVEGQEGAAPTGAMSRYSTLASGPTQVTEGTKVTKPKKDEPKK